MAKVPLIAGVDCWYDGCLLKRGQRFSATPHDAIVLKTLKRATDADADSTLPEATIEPLTSADLPKRKRGRPRKTESTDESPRIYRRRDLEPENQ